MAIWFTVRLEDRPGSLARLAATLGERGINITGIVGVAEDTGGALMLTTSDADGTRAALDAGGVAFVEHDSAAAPAPEDFAEVREGLAQRGIDVGRR